MKRICAFIPALLFLCAFSYGQTITIVRFDNTLLYAAGSGVSVHFRPNLFKPGNTFSLQLSDAAGNFGSPVTIGTVNDFFVPVINGKIPGGTAAGSNYRLRIVGSNPAVVSAVTSAFSINGSTALATPALSTVNPPTIPVKCIVSENVFGFLNITTGGSSTPMNVIIQGYSAADAYTVNLVNSAGSVMSVLSVNAGNGNVAIGGLSIGYYVVELVKVSSGIATVYSYVVLAERDGTGLLNLSSEHVCTGSVVQFKVENIDGNYPGSQYKIYYGDGSAIETYTHDSLIANPLLSHTFVTPTCNSSFATSGAFTVDLQLQNKGLSNNCSGYTTNSTKKAVVNASTPPTANFTVPQYICQTNGIKATNTSVPGSYGSGSVCLKDFISTWQYRKPSSSDYMYAPDAWISPITGHLTIPASEVTEPGCWILKLEVQNPQGCNTITTKEQQISVEVPATPNFSVNPPGICLGQSVQLTDLSNAQGACQNPQYSWTITPSTGFTPMPPTGPNPLLTFNTGGVYTVQQNITNSCGMKTSAPQTITVGGAPTVSFQNTTLNVCKPGTADEIIDFSQGIYKPTYSTTPFAPNSYVWTVSGDPADYEFITANTVNYPKIRFKSFRCFDVTVTVNGNCNPANSKTVQLCFKQSPQITNTTLSQVICSGGSNTDINIAADMGGVSFNWQASYTGVTPASPLTGNTGTIPAQTYAVTGSTAGNITYTLQALVNGCTGPSKQYVVTVTPAVNAAIEYETPLCSTVASAPVKRTGTAGGTYTATAGLVIDAVTGAISPAVSTPGTHTVTYTINPSPPCAGVNATATVVINQGSSASAAISYPAALCNVANTSGTPNPPVPVVQTGTSGGVFSITPAGLTIDPATGTISPAGAKPGAYTVTYTLANTPGCADFKITTIVNVNEASAATISYAGPLCTSMTNVPVNRTGTAGGTYTASTALVIDAATGAINAGASTPGSYTVTYTVAQAGPCPGVTATTDVTVNAAPTAAISYPAILCNVVNSPTTPNPAVAATFTGSPGGTYSISPLTGLKLDAATGSLDPSGAQPGTYTVSYTIAATGGCSQVVAKATVTVSSTPAATIQYASPICNTVTAATVTLTGTRGGSFTASPAGLVIDVTIGTINAQQSTPGSYQITYTVAPSPPCPGATAVTNVVITQAPSASISYPATLCNVPNTTGTPNPSVAVNFTGSTGGTYSVSPASGLPVNITTGLIDPSGATPGNYNIVYTIPASGGCAVYTKSASIVVSSSPQATISYPQSPYCNGITQPQPVTRTGSAGGVYTSTAGLSIDANTGAINPATSIAGIYTVTYSITPVAPCYPFSTTASVTITEAPIVSFSNPVQSICSGGSVTFKGSSSLGNANLSWSVAGALPAGVSGTSSGTVQAPATDISLSFTNTGSIPQTITVNVTPVNPAQNPCAGAPVALTLHVNPIPAEPLANDTIKLCQGSAPTALTAVAAPGNQLIWYNTSMQLLPSAPVPSTTIPSRFVYYVSQSNGFNCESAKKKVVVIVNPTPFITYDALKDPTDCGIPSGAIMITAKDLNGTTTLPNTLIEVYYNKDHSTNVSGPFNLTSDANGQVSIALAAGTYSNVQVRSTGCTSNVLAGPYTLKDPTPPGKPTAGYNVNLCSNDTLLLTALSVPGVLGNGSPNGSVPVVYVWAGPAFGNGNYTTSSSTIKLNPPLDQVAGFYVVYAKQGNCRSVETSFSVTVKQAPTKPALITRNPLCVGDALNIQAVSTIAGGNPQLDYTWTGPGLNIPVHAQSFSISNAAIKDAGLYSITVTSTATGCSAKTDTLIGVGNYPDITLGQSLVTLPTGTQLPLTPTILNAGMEKVLPIQHYTWTPSSDIKCNDVACGKAVITVKNNICYLVKATNIYGCSDTASICINAFCESAQLFIPNAFTPDGDNVNDIFMVRATGIATVKSFRIFNRYGDIVFEKYNFQPNSPAYGWNGSINGRQGTPAVYVFVVEVVCENGTEYKKHGNVTLLR